jgi:predicted metal-dependent hydrolase
LHPLALRGLQLFAAGEYFEAHEALEEAWREERGEVRGLYQGILQAAVFYLHLQRNNYPGARKMHQRCQTLLEGYPPLCRGVHVADLRRSLDTMLEEATRLGEGNLHRLRPSLFVPPHFDV